MRKWVFFIESSEICLCPECGGLLKYRDKVPRIQKQIGGEKQIYMINRMKCSNVACGKLHRQLTDRMVKFKHFAAQVIEDVIDEVISEEDGLDHPCDGTMMQWRLWFARNMMQMDGYMRSVGHRLCGFFEGFLKPAESLLTEIRERINPGWLGIVCRIVNNSGGALLTGPL